MAELTAEEVKRWAEIIGKPAGAHKTQLEQWCVTASGLLLQLLDAQKWREIETAPKDGTPVLLCDERTGSIRWAVWAQLPSHAEGHNSDWLGWRDGTIEAGGQTVGVIPTHWRPLPLPPLKEQGE